MAIDKNPKQITRLRVEDQVQLEKMLSKTAYYHEGDIDYIYFEANIDFECPVIFNDMAYFYDTVTLSEIQFDELGTMLYYNGEDNEFIFNDKDGNETHLVLPAGESEILTSGNIKTLFGDKSIVGSGNIDLYRHQLTGVLLDNNMIYMQIISSESTLIDSIQDLTAVTKATSGYVVNGIVRVNGVMNAAYIEYNGSTWNVYYNDKSSSIKTVNDKLTTI